MLSRQVTDFKNWQRKAMEWIPFEMEVEGHVRAPTNNSNRGR
jgi:hypothetical protein